MKSKKDNLNFAPEKLPKHISFIMDGNGRWAKKRLLPRNAGHKAGLDTLKKIVREIFDLSIPYVSLYAFSTENKGRPQEEIDGLFDLFRRFFSTTIEDFIKIGASIRYMGDLSYFPDDIKQLIASSIQRTSGASKKVLNIGLNYGSRGEIVHAVNKAVLAGKPITEEQFSDLLYTGGMPDPDIMVRTGGDVRLSNFMLYQLAYTELFFVDTLWPNFNKKALYKILNEYAARDRRFGKV